MGLYMIWPSGLFRKKKVLKFIVVNLLTLPLKVIVFVWALVLVIQIRALRMAHFFHTRLEFQENAKNKKPIDKRAKGWRRLLEW